MMEEQPFASMASLLVDGSEVPPAADVETLRSAITRARTAAGRRDAWRVLGRG
jgi:hypothetical protein